MAFFGSPIFPQSVSAVTTVAEWPLGTRRVDSAGNQYVYGYNAGTTSLWPGCPAIADAATSYSFTTNQSAGSQVGFAVAVVHHATIPAGSYGWLGTKGLFRAVAGTDGVSMNAGDQLGVGEDGGWVSAYCGNVYSTGMVFGFAVESLVTGYGSCASEATSGLATLGRAWINTPLA